MLFPICGGGYIDLGYANSTSSGYHNVIADITDPQSAKQTLVNWSSASTDSTSLMTVLGTGIVATSTQYDGLCFFLSAGTIDGTMRIYGYNNNA